MNQRPTKWLSLTIRHIDSGQTIPTYELLAVTHHITILLLIFGLILCCFWNSVIASSEKGEAVIVTV